MKANTRYVLAEVYQDGRKVKQYKTNRGLRDCLSLYAQVMPEAKVKVKVYGKLRTVEFERELNADGSVHSWGWKISYDH